MNLWNVFTFSPIVTGQRATDKTNNGFVLFHFAKYERKGNKTFLRTAQGDEYVLEFVGCRGLSERQISRNGKICMYVKKHIMGGFFHSELKIAPGIDVALMLLFMDIKAHMDQQD